MTQTTVVYEVWALPRKRPRGQLVHFATFDEHEWQFALKLRARLREDGHKRVRIVKVELDDFEEVPAGPAVSPVDGGEPETLLPEF